MEAVDVSMAVEERATEPLPTETAAGRPVLGP